MYEYKSSLTLRSRAGSVYQTPNLKFELVAALYTNYYKVILELSHPASDVPLYLDMADVRTSLAAFTGNVKRWLELNGSASLPTTTEKPSLSLRYARYGELTRTGYVLFKTNEGVYYPPGVDTSGLSDVGVSRDKTDMKHVNDHSLITINGFVHDTSANEDTLYIRKGAVTAKLSDKYTSGMINFSAIGKLTKFKLQKEKITAFEHGTPMSVKARIEVDGFDPSKPFFMVMGGYIVFPKAGELYQAEENGVVLCLEQLNYIERLLESVNFIDLTSLELTTPNNMGGEGWITEQANSDEVIRRYLTLSQSFLVQVDAPNLTIKQHVLRNEPYPGRYLVSQEPVDPIMVAHGRVMEYWPIRSKIGWIIDSNDNYKRDYAYSESGPIPNKMFDRTPDITNRNRLSGAYSLEIYSSL